MPKRPEPKVKVIDQTISEAEFQRQVTELARLRGWAYYHTVDSKRSHKGFPDLVLVKNRIIYAELKTRLGRVKEEQRSWLDMLQRAGAEVYLWRPIDLPDIANILSAKYTPPTEGTT